MEGVGWLPLTARQTAVVECVACGLSDKQIARELGVSYRTVRTHWERIFARWDIHSRPAIVALQIRHGRGSELAENSAPSFH